MLRISATGHLRLLSPKSAGFRSHATGHSFHGRFIEYCSTSLSANALINGYDCSRAAHDRFKRSDLPEAPSGDPDVEHYLKNLLKTGPFDFLLLFNIHKTMGSGQKVNWENL